MSLIVRTISSLCRPQNQPAPNMILKFSFVPNIRDNPYHPNRPFQSSILTKNIILQLLFLELTKDSWSKINSNKSWIIRNRSEIHLKNIISLYFYQYFRFFRGPTPNIHFVLSVKNIIKIIMGISFQRNIETESVLAPITIILRTFAISILTFGMDVRKKLMRSKEE